MFKSGDIPIPGYHLIRRIGQGAYGEVWEAQAPGGARAALKFIPLQSAAGGIELKAANAVKLIRHANLIPITAIWVLDRLGNVLDDQALELIDQGVSAHSTIVAEDLERKENLAYLVIAMALADECLATQFKRYRDEGATGIPADILLEYMRDAAKGLDFLNEPRHLVGGERVGIVHRDIKPANLLLLGDSVVVGDFGVATSLRDFDVQATRMVGSLAFMAPELLSSHPTPSTDQYALAITYYYLRTGVMPFEDGHTFDSLAHVHKEGLLNFSHVPEAERTVLTRATAVPPAPRYPNCASFVAALSNTYHAAPPARMKFLLAMLALFLLALGAIGIVSWRNASGVGENVAERSLAEPAASQQKLKIIPATYFELQLLDSQQTLTSETSQSSETAEFVLHPGEKIKLSAHADSPLYESLDEIFTYEQLEQLDWQLHLKLKTVSEVRDQAFAMVAQKKWAEASELLAMAAQERPEALELPVPIKTPLGRPVTRLSMGDQTHVVTALQDGGRTSFRFSGWTSSSPNEVSEKTPSSATKKSDTFIGNWIDSDIIGVQNLFPLAESGQWIIVMTDTIGQIDQVGKCQLMWHEEEAKGRSFSTATVSHDRRWLACGDYDGTVHVWQIAMDGSLNDYENFAAHEEMVISLDFVGQQNILFSTGFDRSIVQINKTADSTRHVLTPVDTSSLPSNQELVDATETSGERLIVATEHRIWVAASDSKVIQPAVPGEIDGTISLIRSHFLSPWILLGTDSKTKPVQLINQKYEIVQVPADINFSSPVAAVFSENGQWLATSDYQGELLLVNLETDTPLWWSVPKSDEGYRKFLEFSSDGKSLISIDDSGNEEIWPVDEMRLIFQTRTEVAASKRVGS